MKNVRRTVRLETLSEIYDIPLQTLRRWASKRKFPGIIKRRGERRLYVNLSKFDEWCNELNQEHTEGVHSDGNSS